jgi:hypothetical protein
MASPPAGRQQANPACQAQEAVLASLVRRWGRVAPFARLPALNSA